MKREKLEELRALLFESRFIQLQMLSKGERIKKNKKSGFEMNGLIFDYLDDGTQEQFIELRHKLSVKQRKIFEEIYQLENYLESIDNPELRVILRMYYRDGISQQCIAAELGYDHSTVSKKIVKFWELERNNNNYV